MSDSFNTLLIFTSAQTHTSCFQFGHAGFYSHTPLKDTHTFSTHLLFGEILKGSEIEFIRNIDQEEIFKIK